MQIPDSISQLRDLAALRLSVNNLSGEFAPALYNMSSLRFIALTDKKFTGNLRPNIGLSWPNLDRIYLAINFFSGPIRNSFSNASKLLQLDLLGNQFTGQVPMRFGSLPNIQWINVGFNLLGSGQPDDLKFISALTNCSNLLFLHFGDNQFRGILTISIANLSIHMTRIYFENNSISGSIPIEIGNLINLNTLYASNNHLTGVIPPSIGRLSNLGTIVLSSNKFTGEMPSSIGNLKNLQNLYMANNRLKGSIPSTLGNCIKMQLLDLSQNNMSGIIPKQLIQVSTAAALNFSYNSLTGSLPAQISNLSHLVFADFSYKKFSGDIPISMGKLLAVVILYMQNNSLQGTRPYLGHLQALQYLDLSCIYLSGQVPPFLMNLSSLVYLNLSCNSLEGKIPAGVFANASAAGVFANASAVEVLGNPKLCGGIQELYLPTCLVQEPEKVHKKHSVSLKLILILVGVASVIFLSLLLFSVYKIKNFKKQFQVLSTSRQMFPNVSYKLLYDATGGFSSENLLCSGSFGTVYKGTLSPDDTVVTVKVLHLHQPGASQSFMAECQALRNIRHRNLIKTLPKLSVGANSHEFSSLGIKGTIGYAAPEYGMGAQVSILGDVYSFGILVLEIFTGKRPTDEQFLSNGQYHIK